MTRISDVAVLSIEVESVEDIAAVKSWNVVANGRPVGARVSYANGHLVLTAPGTVFLVK